MSSAAIVAAKEQGYGRFAPEPPPPATLAYVLVAPATFIVEDASVFQLTATAYDTFGIAVPGQSFDWDSSDDAVATVGASTGLVTAVDPGGATISATTSGLTGTSACTVIAAGAYSPLNAPSTTKYVPRPHPWAWPNPPAFPAETMDTRYGYDTTLPNAPAITFANGGGAGELLQDQGNINVTRDYLQQYCDAAAMRDGHTLLRLPSNFQSAPPIARKNTRGNYWLYFKWESLAVAEGTRATPADLTNAPILWAPWVGEPHVFALDRQANRVRFIGIKMKATDGWGCYDLCYVCPTQSSNDLDTDINDITDWIIIDRCVLEGNDDGTGITKRVRNGLTFTTRHGAIIDSTIHRIGWAGVESHAICAYNTPGPLKIVNNALEATSAHFMFGGVGAKYGVVAGRPADAEIRRNHCYRRQTWNANDPSYDGSRCYLCLGNWGSNGWWPEATTPCPGCGGHYVDALGNKYNDPGPGLTPVAGSGVIGRGIKNSFEVKNGQRFLVEGNVFEQSWASGQQGYLVVIKSGGGGFVGDFSIGEGFNDLTLRYNIARRGAVAWNFVGVDGSDPLFNLKRVAMYHSLAYDIGAPRFANGGSNQSYYLASDIDDLYIRHNTTVIIGPPMAISLGYAGGAERLTWQDDIAPAGYIWGDAGNGTAALNGWAQSWTWARNLMPGLGGDLVAMHPPGTYACDTTAGVGYVDAANYDFHLAPSSNYYTAGEGGVPLGANIDDVNTATSGVAPPP